MAKTKKVTASLETVAIVGFTDALERASRSLNRLRGIVAGFGHDTKPEKTRHRLTTVVGYRKNTLDNFKRLYAKFQGIQEVLDNLE